MNYPMVTESAPVFGRVRVSPQSLVFYAECCLLLILYLEGLHLFCHAEFEFIFGIYELSFWCFLALLDLHFAQIT